MVSKLYPKKIMIILSCLLFALNIGISLIVLNTNKVMAIEIFAVFLVVTVILVTINFLLHKITLTRESLIIKVDGNKGLKKYKILLKNIKKTECIEVKLGIASDKIFNIHYLDSGIDKVLKVNQNMYFIKDLQGLFECMEKTYKIPCVRE